MNSRYDISVGDLTRDSVMFSINSSELIKLGPLAEKLGKKNGLDSLCLSTNTFKTLQTLLTPQY